jgi:hypothetical protein
MSACISEGQQHCKQQTHPLVREDVTMDYHRKFSVEKHTGRERQGASDQGELIGGKQPVVK